MLEKATKQPTLEQQRAKHAWNKSEGCSKEYMNLAKGLPALIMNSGLMQVMAFLHQKSDVHKTLAGHLREWLHERFSDVPIDFSGCMEHLLAAGSRDYQAITTEAFAWLKWLRQMAAARHKDA